MTIQYREDSATGNLENSSTIKKTVSGVGSNQNKLFTRTFDYERKKLPEEVYVDIPYVAENPIINPQPKTIMENLVTIQGRVADAAISRRLIGEQAKMRSGYTTKEGKVITGMGPLGRIAEHSPSFGIPEKAAEKPLTSPEKKDFLTKIFDWINSLFSKL